MPDKRGGGARREDHSVLKKRKEREISSQSGKARDGTCKRGEGRNVRGRQGYYDRQIR